MSCTKLNQYNFPILPCSPKKIIHVFFVQLSPVRPLFTFLPLLLDFQFYSFLSLQVYVLIVNSTTQVRLQCPWRRSWRPKARGHAKAEVASTACCKKNLKKLLKIFRKKTIFLLQLKCQSSRGQFRPGVKKNLKKKFYKSEKNNSQLILKMNWQSSRGQCSLL